MHDIMIDFETVTPDLWAANEQAWTERLLKLPNWHQIPLINSNASHNLPDGTLVRFRGMVQDMYDPEFYLSKFEVYNAVTNELKNKTAKYKDTADIMKDEKINYTENFTCSERQSLVVVSIPGLNDWAQLLEDKQNHLSHLEDQPNTSKRLTSNLKLKRSYDDAEEDSDAMEVDAESNKEPKVAEKVEEPASVVSREHILNFPLPDVPSKSSIIKIYDESDNLKLNEMVEIVGFLSVDPSLSVEFHQEDPLLETKVEKITHNPPPSLVPRIHAVHVKRLEHCNPLIRDEVNQEAALQTANQTREHLLKALTELLLGDQLAAEYLICHLISHVYLRQDTQVLGQFCLNLSNLPPQRASYARQLYDVVRQFVTHSYYFPMTVDNMNDMALVPKKDHQCNRVTSGILQLPAHTHLVIDETCLRQGTLNSAGLANMAALSQLIQDQKVAYDFKYHKLDFHADVPVLILSEGKCLLPSDFHVPLRPDEASLQIFDAIVEAATYYLKEDIMNLIRTYLTQLKLVKFTISEEAKFIVDDYVEMRSKSDEQNRVTSDDLHRMLVLSRLVSLSRGFSSLNKECWDVAKNMETERQRRIKK